MTEPVLEQPSIGASFDQDLDHDLPPFTPIFTLVNNTSTRTTHHPHVRYIFSDDDPDILTQALAEIDSDINESTSDPVFSPRRAMILDLAPDSTGGYNIAWASSLSSSWAILDAQLSQISSPSSDGGSNNGNEGGDGNNRVDRLMLRIDGVETGGLGSEGGLSGEASRQGSGTASGGSGHHDRDREIEDYTNIVDKFERRMTTLRKIVDASEERRRKIAVDDHVTAGLTEKTIEDESRPAE
ncbi:hypothetical protein GGS26DRAFT_185817 [Hypomontagnella submonticulosa]|nr:hypothetical protein GGS26DRAFT_185817 [Hypomontagnella submonticulosa]